MRLWHKDLISVLPRKQLVAQWRECCLIAKNIAENGTPNHILVNKIMSYPVNHFCYYGRLIELEMTKRDYRVKGDKFDKWLRNENYAVPYPYPTYKKNILSKKTYSDYCSYFRLHILPYFGDFTLSEITPRMITARLLEFGETHKHNSTIKLYVILSTFFDMALMDDTIETNPMQKVNRPKQQKEKKVNNDSTVKSLSLDELKHVLKCLESEPLKWQTYVYLLFDTGCRRSELLALNWTDINFDTGILQINKSIGYTPENGEYITTPKNGKSRTVDIGEKSLSLLKALHKEQLNNGILSQWVFTQDGSAERMFYNTPTGYFDSFGKRYGVENFHPHILRHTSATLSILNGADVTSVAARLGHSDVSTTLRFYAHANQESIKKVGDTVRNLIAETS